MPGTKLLAIWQRPVALAPLNHIYNFKPSLNLPLSVSIGLVFEFQCFKIHTYFKSMVNGFLNKVSTMRHENVVAHFCNGYSSWERFFCNGLKDSAWEKKVFSSSGANPSTLDSTTTTPDVYNARCVLGESIFRSRRNYFCFQNALGYSWRCNFLKAMAL
jgi:hypothetical protein